MFVININTSRIKVAMIFEVVPVVLQTELEYFYSVI